MRIYATDRGIARETEPGALEVLHLPCADIGDLLVGPGLDAVGTTSPVSTVSVEEVRAPAPVRPVHRHASRRGLLLAPVPRDGVEIEIEQIGTLRHRVMSG